MKKFLLTISVSLSFGIVSAASFYDSVKIVKSDGSSFSCPAALMDSIVSDPKLQNVFLSIPRSEIKEIVTPDAVPAESVNLSADGKKNYFNTLRAVSFKDKNGTVLSARFGDDNSASIVLPPFAKYADFTASFDTDGSYIYVNGTQAQNGSGQTIPMSSEIKIVSFSGEVQTYNITVSYSKFPVVSVTSPENVSEITSDWSEGFVLRTSNPDGTVTAENTVEFRGRGGSFSSPGSDKYAYGIKFDKKSRPLNMTKGKRWILLPCKADKTLLRSGLAFDIYKKYLGSCWTPSSSPCELVIDGGYKGTYLLTEQVRITDERIPEGIILSVENEKDDDDDAFRSKQSKSLFVFQDPDAGSIGTRLIRTQALIDEFEALLFSSNSADKDKAMKMIDANSFADWIVINEIAKNSNAFLKDCYLNISPDNLIKMGPVWDMSDFFGNSTSESTDDFVAKNTAWAAELIKDASFAKLVYDRFEKVYSSKSEILSLIDQQAANFEVSAKGNEQVQNSFGLADAEGERFANEYAAEIKRLKIWLEKRLEWLHKSLKP